MDAYSPAEIRQILENRTPRPIGKYLHSAVMVLLFQIDGNMHILFNKRAANLKHQPGDICFPGGRQEGNETPLETALRETWEELGIQQQSIEILGQTDYMITASGAVITPFVGFVKDIIPDDIRFSTDEVAEIFTVPITYFIETMPEVHYIRFKAEYSEDFPYERIAGGRDYRFSKPLVPEYFYDYCGHVIWGITARITEHVISLIANAKE